MYKMDYDTKDISYIQKAIELGEDEVFAYCIRGSIAYNIKEYQLAINDFTIAMDRDFCRDICYYQRAKCYLFLDNIEKAIEDFSKSIELDSQNSNAYSWRAYCYEFKGKYDKAILDYKKALELGDDTVEKEIQNCIEKQKEQMILTEK